MPLSAGTRLGPYEVLGPLGHGGMGEVYRAKDTTLGREVAIKILSEALAGDPDSLARFEREAKVLASLNHPHIATIYGIEQSAIVMELVEGENIKGPVPVDEAIATARQIANALDAAHQRNIIHRDLKPANVKITPEGIVKVLDFGLAKAFNANAVSGDPMNSPTFTMEATRAGMILGTAGYMSPEQARGRPVDKRADIWSFGAVFYELLTGHRAFEGESVTDTLAAVLTSEPDWTRLPAATPVGVRKLLKNCLQRDLNKRLRDIGDAWIEIDGPVVVEAVRSSKFSWVPWATAAAVMVVAAMAWQWLRAPADLPRTVTRSAFTIAGITGGPALSHDGTHLAYVDGAGRISVRMMNQLEGKAIPGADGTNPVFSPDGQWIAYIRRPSPFKLEKIGVAGGRPTSLCDVPAISRLSWEADGTILFGSPKGVMSVSADGGTPRAVTTVSEKNRESGHYAQDLLPGGHAIVFTQGTGAADDAADLAMLNFRTGAYSILVRDARGGRYAPTGHLVYHRGETLFATPFDLKSLTVSGPEAAVEEGIADANSFTFSDSSLLVIVAAIGTDPSTLEWTDRKGAKSHPLPEPPRRWSGFALSPNGKLIAGSIRDSGTTSGSVHSDIWIYDIERRAMTRLTFEGSNDSPVWTPDGRWVTYDSIRNGKHGLYRVPSDKSGQPQLLIETETPAYPSSWTPDATALLYGKRTAGKEQVWVLPAAGNIAGTQPRTFHQTSFEEYEPKVSPDGKWVAYTSAESGKIEVYVLPFSGSGGRTQISAQGGFGPQWSRSGRELIYHAESDDLMAVDIQTAPVFRAGHPQVLFKVASPGQFEVTPDPNQFLVERVSERAATTTFVTITEWFEDLRRKAPAAK
jgi:Tol biopolymer transport system component/predicted Ser/Thr protein kinase